MKDNHLPVYIWLPILMIAALLGGGSIVYKEEIKDWWFFRSYQPSAEIQDISNRVDFTDEGERLFFRADPEFIKTTEASSLCLGVDNIGCLVTGPKLYIVEFESDREEEDDLQAVTAAHEMLHLVYSRLKGEEKDVVDRMIAFELSKPRNRDLFRKVNAYEDLFVREDEAHSRVATEATDFAPALEEYFDQYFTSQEEVFEAHERSKSLLN